MVVAIDKQEPDHPSMDGRLRLIGDATDDHVIGQARMDKAKALIVALDSDIDNLFITLTARSLNPDLFIVARANEPAVIPKLEQVGADRVVSPHHIGGARLAALVLHPEVVEFVDVVMQDGSFEVRLAEALITDRSPFARCSLQECAIRTTTGATVLAVLRQGDFITNPAQDLVLQPDDRLISLGTPEQLEALAELVRQR